MAHSTNEFKERARKLRDNNTEVRRVAIEWLAQSKDRRALEPLRFAAANDPDEMLRQQADMALRYLEKRMERRQTNRLLAIRDTQVAQALDSVDVKEADTALYTRGTDKLVEDVDPERHLKRQRKTDRLPSHLDTSHTYTVSDSQARRQVESAMSSGPKIDQRRGRAFSGHHMDSDPYAIPIDVAAGLANSVLDDSQASRERARQPQYATHHVEDSNPYNVSRENLAAGLDGIVENYEHYEYADPTSENYVNRHDWELARVMITNAVDDHVHGKFVGALRKLYRAVDLDPSVEREPAMERAIKLIMDMTLADGMAMIRDHGEREAFLVAHAKRSRDLFAGRNMGHALAEVAFLLVIAVAASFLSLNVLRLESNTLEGALLADREYQAALRIDGDPAPFLTRLHGGVGLLTAGEVVNAALTVGGALTIAFVVATLLAYIVSNPQGNLGDAISNHARVQTTFLAIAGTLTGFMTFVFYPMNSADAARFPSIPIVVLSLLLLGGGLVFSLWRIYIAIRYGQETGPLRAGVALAVGSVALVVMVAGVVGWAGENLLTFNLPV